MYCIQCGNNQSEGNFCAKCGTALRGDLPDAVQTRAVELRSQPNDYAKKVKAMFKMYGQYFLKHLKQPIEIFKQGEKEFTNGSITIGILSIFVGMAIFIFIKDVESSWFSVLGSTIVCVLISLVITLGSLYVTTLLLGPEQPIKKLIGIYGTHLIPSTFLVLIALILLLVKANTFGTLLFLFALLFALFIVPLYILIMLLAQDESVLDPLYSIVVYMVIFGTVSSLCLMLFGDSIVGNMMSWLDF